MTQNSQPDLCIHRDGFSKEQFQSIVSALDFSLREKSLDMAMGRFFSTPLVVSIMQSRQEQYLMEALTVIVKLRVGYSFPIKSIESAVRIYLCYFNTTWFGMHYFDSDWAACQVKWRKNWTKSRHFQAAPRDHGKCVWINSCVIMSCGSMVMLRNIKEGDQILSFDESDFKIKSKTVIAKLDTGVKPLYQLTTRTGRQIRTTQEHRYYTADGWKELKDLVSGEHIAVPRGYCNDTNRKELTSKHKKWAYSDVLWDSVQSIEYVEDAETCDLQIEDTCSFIANDIIVHNSHVYSFENPLWHICYVDNIRILSASKSDSLAEKYLGAIKRTIETNQRLLEDFGDLTENVNPVDGSKLEGGKGKGGWAKNQLFCRRTNYSLKDGTIESIGWGCAITGSRFDLIILDDPIEESDCRTAKARKAQTEMIHVLEELLEPQGKFHVIGTRKHYDDLYSYLIKNPRWTYSIDSGIIKYPVNFTYVFEEDPETGKQIAVDVDIPEGEEYKVLWEEKWSIKDLLLKKYGSLPMHFLRDIQNEVTSDETSDFPEDIINGCRDIEILGTRKPFYKSRPDWARWIVQGIDLSAIFSKKRAEEKDSDFFNVTTLAIPFNNYEKHLIHGFRTRGIDADDQLNKIIELDYDFEPDIIVLETNAYQKAMEGLALKKKLPIYPHTTGSEKWGVEEGLPKMNIEMKNKYFVFYTGTGEAEIYFELLFSELHGFGVEKHDDSVMSLWLANLGATWLIKKDMRKKRRQARNDKRQTEEVAAKKLDTMERSSASQEQIDKAMQELEERMKRYM